MRRWIEQIDDDDQWEEFKRYNGIEILMEILSKEELKARETRNYAGIII